METITTKKKLYHPPMVKSIEKEQEDDFYYELSAEDIQKIEIGREQCRIGMTISSEKLQKETREKYGNKMVI